MEETQDRTIRLCHALLSAFDPLVGKQTEITVDIARKMASGGGFESCGQTLFLQSAWLYHLGVIHLERELLHRRAEGKMSDEDWASFRGVPAASAEFVKLAFGSGELANIVLAHRERFDGEGYPNGLAGESIPWAARCLAVAVHFSESTLEKEELLEEIENESGKAFDPEAVRLFFKTTQDDLPPQIREVLVSELQSGMMLAREIVTRNGLLLLPEGAILDSSSVAKINNYHLLNEITQRLLIFR